MHHMRSHLKLLALAATLAVATSLESHAHGDGTPPESAASSEAYVAKSEGTRTLVAGPVSIRMLLDASNLGDGSVEVGELLLPAEVGAVPSHQHGALEIFYVLDGVLRHEVNGVSHILNPGELGFVKAGDAVIHEALHDNAVRALVIWAPGGESDALLEYAGFKVQESE